jgi:UDP-N-acetylmuramoylalanine--D-glutamate ligase
MMNNWSEKRVLIIGAARQGLALARFLANEGARVTLNDKQSAESLKSTIDEMKDVPVYWVTGGHPIDLLETTDVVCLSGGVPLNIPIVPEAIRRGLPLSNDTQVFMEVVPCNVIGITGSAGKTTTTTLVGRMAVHAILPPSKSWVGGNIGLPLISSIHEMQKDDLVVMEVSSFQLEQTTLSPQIAAILNITPNHLDRHGTMEMYVAAKARILAYQTEHDIAILNREDPGSWILRNQVKGNLVTFGEGAPGEGLYGTFIQNGMICNKTGNQTEEVLPVSSVALRGKHNLINVLAAVAIAKAAGFNNQSILAGVEGFEGVAHRLEFVREFRGARWYNDSIATAPERTMAAIRAFVEPLILLCGGRDKNLPWGQFAELVHQRVKILITFGEAADLINRAVATVQKEGQLQKVVSCSSLEDAVQTAALYAEAGDVVLLSPGGTSFDEFKDFEERGEVYRKWVQQLS